jgi:hypothetical protein
MFPLGKKSTIRIVLGTKPSKSNFVKLGRKPIRIAIGHKKPTGSY